MPTLHRLRDISIVIYTRDHEPPHVHAVCPAFEVRLFLGSWRVQTVRGRPGRLADVIAWAQENEGELKAAWDRTRSD